MRVALWLIALAIYHLSISVSGDRGERDVKEAAVHKLFGFLLFVFAIMDVIDFIG